MHIRHSIKNVFRSWPKSTLFFLLLAALSAVLCIGVSLTSAILDFLRSCDENYTSIAVFEYIGEGYPDETRYDPDITRCMEEFDFTSLNHNPVVIGWDSNETALGCISGKDVDSTDAPYKNMLVAVVFILSYNERIGAYQYSIIENLLDPDAKVTGGYLDTSVVDLEIGHVYLIHGSSGSRYTGMGNTSYLIVAPFNIASAAAAGVDVSIEDMIMDVGTGGGNYEVPPDSILYQIAETYSAVNTSITVQATNDLEAFLPFQQAELSVISGRSFTADEYESGAQVCLLPERMAELLSVEPGDRIGLSIAVQEGASRQESYWAGTGFSYSNSYTVVGIFSPNDDYRETVFIPKSAATDLSSNRYSFTLGQARLKNSGAEQFYLDMLEALPHRVRITVYDQGYSAAAAPVRDVLRIAVIITVVCALTTLAMLALFGFLFVYRQRGLVKTMRRVGVVNGGVFTYFLFGSGCIALLGAAAGAFVSHTLSGAFMELVRRSIANYSTDNLRYSNANLTVSKTIEFAPDIAPVVFILTALALFAFAVLACYVFTSVSVRSKTAGGRSRAGKRSGGDGARSRSLGGGVRSRSLGGGGVSGARSRSLDGGGGGSGGGGARSRSLGGGGVKSRSLNGGALKYAWISVQRGGSRTFLPVILCALAAALILQLTSTTVAYESGYNRLVEETDITGYITDFRGAWRYGLMLDAVVINDLYYSGILSNVSVTKSGYHYAYDLQTPEEWNMYSIETYTDNVSSGPGFIWTNDLAATHEFYGCADLPVTFMSDYDLSIFSYLPPEDEPFELEGVYDNWVWPEQEVRPIQCIVSTAFLEEHTLAYGDIFEVSVSEGDSFDFKTMEIIGSYVKQGSADNIYIPLSNYHIYEFGVKAVGRGGSALSYTYKYDYLPSSYIFSPDPDVDLLNKLALSSVSFKMRGASGLDAFKSFLFDRGYSEVNQTREIRSYITIEDKTFLATERAMSQRLWYMQKIFPALYVLLELLSALIPFILVQLRKRESALMRAQGASKSTAFSSIFAEQIMLCIPGVLIGGGLWLAAAGTPTRLGLALAVLFALFWLFGAGISAFSLNRGSVRTILKAEE